MRWERARWAISRLFSEESGHRAPQAGAKTVVRVRQSLDHTPSTPIARKVLLALADAPSLEFAQLVKLVADELYDEELRNGAGVLDIGLFGSRLFDDEVIRELHSGDGKFWKIQKPQDG